MHRTFPAPPVLLRPAGHPTELEPLREKKQALLRLKRKVRKCDERAARAKAKRAEKAQAARIRIASPKPRELGRGEFGRMSSPFDMSGAGAGADVLLSGSPLDLRPVPLPPSASRSESFGMNAAQ